MSYDVRLHNYHIVTDSYEKWSTNWTRFPGLPFAFQFEYEIRLRGNNYQKWMQDNWYYSLWITSGYLLVIYLLKNYMKNRKPLQLKLPLILWNGLLTIFSLVGMFRCLPEFVNILLTHGMFDSYCNGSYYLDIRITVWYLFFVLSKVFELGDTIFIVLRKQKLQQFHCVHHALTLCYSWYVFGDVPATARWMVNMNFIVHLFLYLYYTLKALKFNLSKTLAMYITLMEIIQMLFGFYINLKAYLFKISGQPCDISMSVATFGFILYSIFFILFLNYFFKFFIHSQITTFKTIKLASDSDYCNDVLLQKQLRRS